MRSVQGAPGMVIALAVVRTLIGLLFVVTGVMGFARYHGFSQTYAYWQIPYPEFSVFVFAALEVVCGTLLMIGGLVRPAACVLAAIVLEIWLMAGRIEGGFYIVMPPLLCGALLFYAWRSGRARAWSPAPRKPGTAIVVSRPS